MLILDVPILFKISDFLKSIINVGMIIKVTAKTPIETITGKEIANCFCPIVKNIKAKNKGSANAQRGPTTLFKKYLFNNLKIAIDNHLFFYILLIETIAFIKALNNLCGFKGRAENSG